LRHGCLCAFILCLCCPVQVPALRRADHPSKESYQLCKCSRNWKGAKVQQKGCRAIGRFCMFLPTSWHRLAINQLEDIHLVWNYPFYIHSGYSWPLCVNGIPKTFCLLGYNAV
jgi:hypothetical protein